MCHLLMQIHSTVMIIATAESIGHAIELANSSMYTLTSFLWTNDMYTAFDVSSRIRAGSSMPALKYLYSLLTPFITQGKSIVNSLLLGIETRFFKQEWGIFLLVSRTPLMHVLALRQPHFRVWSLLTE